MQSPLLSQLGFSDKETEVYTTILQYGKISPASLAKITKLNRTTVYSVAKELIKRGVVAEDLAGPSLLLMAKSPAALEVLAETEARALKEKKEIIKQAAEQLQSIVKTANYEVQKIVFVREDELERHLYQQTPVWAESIRKNGGIWWGFQDHTFVEHYEKWIDWSWESGVQQGVNLKLISNEEEKKVKKKTFPDRQIKFWDQSKHFTATTWICGDYVIMLVTNKRPHYLVEICDKILALNQREIFKGLWQTIEKTRD